MTFVKTLRKDGEIAGVVNKETLTREIVTILMEAGTMLSISFKLEQRPNFHSYMSMHREMLQVSFFNK